MYTYIHKHMCKYVNIYIYVCTYTYMRKHLYIHLHIYTYKHSNLYAYKCKWCASSCPHMHACEHIYIYTCTYVCWYTYIYTNMYICIYIYIYICIYIYIYMYMFIHMHICIYVNYTRNGVQLHTTERVLAFLRIALNESCQICERVTSYIWINHVTHAKEPCQTTQGG